MPTELIKCSCDGFLGNRAAAKFQDAAYGAGVRVHNKTAKSDAAVFRCSVCRAERGQSGGAGAGKKDAKKKS